MEKLKILLLFAIGLTSQVLFAQNRTIQGIVTSAEDGEPLIGATVVLKDNPSVGAATDINGRYTFTIPENAKVLVVSYLGMKTQEVRIMRSNKLNIALQPDEHLLQEVVVTGYGNFTRSSFTGSASTVRADMDQRRKHYKQLRTAGSNPKHPHPGHGIVQRLARASVRHRRRSCHIRKPEYGRLRRFVHEQLQDQHHEFAEPFGH